MKTLRTFSYTSILLLALSVPGYASDIQGLAQQQVGTSAPAQQCLDDLRAFDEMRAEFGFAVLPPGGYDIFAPTNYYGTMGTPRQVIRYLRESARVFALDGDEESCQRALRAMRTSFDQHNELVGLENDDPAIRTAWRRAHLARAIPVDDMARFMRADLVIGAEVRNLQDKRLGEVDDLVLDPKDRSIAYVLLAHGGFAGIGTKLIAVRWRDLRATEDHEIFVLDVLESALDDAPTFDGGDFDKSADTAWADDLDRFWDARIGSEQAG